MAKTPYIQNPGCGSLGKDKIEAHRTLASKKAVTTLRGFYGTLQRQASTAVD